MADIIGRIGGTYKHPVVDEIPEELRPDEIVFVKETGSLWVGASESTFPGLDEGTPWPLKGYKEYLRRFDIVAGEISSTTPEYSDFDFDIEFTSPSTGVYQSGEVFSGIDTDDIIWFPQVASETSELNSILSLTTTVLSSRLRLEVRNASASLVSADELLLFPVHFRVYPPQPE